jgi:hypothetical protein
MITYEIIYKAKRKEREVLDRTTEFSHAIGLMNHYVIDKKLSQVSIETKITNTKEFLPCKQISQTQLSN